VVAKINPEILRWARETAGLTIDNAADKIGLKQARGVSGADRLALLESGNSEPSRPILLEMAKRYRRPLLTFYLAAPPQTAARGEDFRLLPSGFERRDTALVDALLRQVRARQEMVRALLEAESEAISLPFVGSFDHRQGAEALAARIVTTLGFDLLQFRNGSGANTQKGFAYLRERAEAAGIFVLLIGNLGSHHSALDIELFRGFALADQIAPFIVINDQDSEAAWSFTLLHELAHIWLGQTGVSGSMPGTPIEIFCNDVAGRILLPSAEIAQERGLKDAPQTRVLTRIGEIAAARKVSHSMVAYKLYREGVISREVWSAVTSFFRQQWAANRNSVREARNGDSGPDYYVVRRHRLGNRLLKLSGRMLLDGALSPSKAAAILGVKPNNVYSLTQLAA
jgi:Zn-dependent peptidase ImmA (M78 family)/transcriptional regulator with XRE-family HTH domain